MVRLIVRDGGDPRAFKVGAGLLRVGADEDSKLRLVSEGVAGHHADLEVAVDHVVLVPVAAGASTTVDGVPVEGRTRVEPGSTVGLGGAVLEVASEEGSVPASGRPVVRARRGGTLAARTRRRSRQGPSPAKILGLSVLGVAVLGAVFWLLFRSTQTDDPGKLLRAVELHLEAGDRSRASEVLARLPDASRLSSAQARRLREAQDELAALRASSEADQANIEGFDYFNRVLERYRTRYLEGDPEADKARLYLHHAREFRERWPTHPRLPEVEAEVGRLEPYADLDDPPRLSELQWIAKSLTGGSPRDYRTVFDELELLLEEGKPGDRPAAEKLRAELETERREYFDEKRDEAQRAFEEGNLGRAIYWYVELVVNVGDEGMADRAAKSLVALPNVEAYLRSIRAETPTRWKRLARNERVEAFAAEAGLL